MLYPGTAMEEFELLPPGYVEERPWGKFIVLEDTRTHKVKRLILKPGKRLSYQRHQKRTEHWVILSGRAIVILDDVSTEHQPGDTIHVPVGAKHRLINAHPEEDLIWIEVQRGSYFGEDDIERFEDDFGRV